VSTKVLRCPWCQATNLTDKLASRHGRCRSCGRDVKWGLTYVQQKTAERRKLKTKAERRDAKRQLQASPEYQTLQRGRKLNRELRQAERSLTLGWSKLRAGADEHDLQAVASAVRMCQQAERKLTRLRRALAAYQVQVRPVAASSRTVILPPSDDGGGHA
jgi:hypothetical protein